jgi:hypothetical protein
MPAASLWLHPELPKLGLAAVCLENQHVRAALKARRNKTDSCHGIHISRATCTQRVKGSNALQFLLAGPFADGLGRSKRASGPSCDLVCARSSADEGGAALI